MRHLAWPTLLLILSSCPYRPVPTFTAVTVRVKSECPTCTLEVVEPAVQFTADFWTIREYPRDCIERAIAKSYISCTSTPDKIREPASGTWCNAYVEQNGWVFMACKKDSREIYSLVIHELSHTLVSECGPSMAISEHHLYFQRMGLGH